MAWGVLVELGRMTDLERLTKVVFGNGDPGMAENVRALMRRQGRIMVVITNHGDEIEELQQFKRDLVSQYKGARLAIGILLSVLGAGGGAIYVQISRILQALPQ